MVADWVKQGREDSLPSLTDVAAACPYFFGFLAWFTISPLSLSFWFVYIYSRIIIHRIVCFMVGLGRFASM